jgi:lysophospholipase L1-like esterase
MPLLEPILRAVLDSRAVRGPFAGGSSGPAFTPASITLAQWLDPVDLASIYQDTAGATPATTAGQTVGRLSDKSGNARHVQQATAPARPALRQDVNGKWYLQLDGVDDLMKVVAGWTAIPQPFTLVLSAKFNQAGSSAYIIDDFDGSSRVAIGKLGTAALSAYAGGQLDIDGDNMRGHVFDGVFNGASSTFKRDGGADITGDAGANGFAGLTLGARFSGANFLQGRFYGLIVAPGVSPARSSLRSWMMTRTGMTLDPGKGLLLEGDSITVGAAASENYQNGWGPKLAQTTPRPTDYVLSAVSGATFTNIESRQAALITSIQAVVAAGRVPILFLLTGANDQPATAGAALTLYNRIVTWANAVRAAGAKLVLCTSVASNPASFAAWDGTGRPALNGYIRGDASKFDALCDFAADSQLNVWSLTNYFDDLHPNDTGHAVMYARALAAYRSL